MKVRSEYLFHQANFIFLNVQYTMHGTYNESMYIIITKAKTIFEPEFCTKLLKGFY